MPVKPSGKPRRKLNPNRPEGLHFYLYAVNGILRRARVTLHVVCCHAADARAMVATRQPEIGNLRVTRGKPIHFIAVGDHALID
jgi:hypothetical protein